MTVALPAVGETRKVQSKTVMLLTCQPLAGTMKTVEVSTQIPLTYLGDGNWRTEMEETYYDTELGYEFIIPPGYVFDLASIPRSIWWLIAPYELSILAPLLHDFVYGYKGLMPDGKVLSEKQTDDLFRKAAWAAVRTVGFTYWNAPNANS
jgi:hypothetical protein